MKIFFDINKSIYKHNQDGSLIKVLNPNECNGGICLVMDNSTSVADKNIFINVYEKNTKQSIIKKDITLELDDNISVNYEHNDKIFVFAMTKSYFLSLIDDYGFDKVYPLEFFLMKMGRGKNGIISNDIMYIRKYDSDYDFKSHYLLSQVESTFYIGLNTDIYINTIDKLIDNNDGVSINIGIYSKDVLENLNRDIKNFDIKYFIQQVKEHRSFHFIDKISNRYKKTILHRYLYFVDFILIGILSLFVFLYLVAIASNSSLNNKVEEQNIQLEKFNNLNKNILKDLPKMSFNKFQIMDTKDSLTEFSKYNPSKFVYSFDSNKNLINIKMTISGISNVESLVSFLKEKKYNNKYEKKRGYDFDFDINIKLDQNQNLVNSKSKRR